MASSLVTLSFLFLTLTFPGIYLASNVVYSFRCEKIQCQSSAFCPPWHYCNLHKRVCDPCTRCIDGSDAARAPANCQDPSFCTDSLYAKQDYDLACPRLRIVEGNSCWGECKPCGGTFGSYLGTTCQARCQDDDWEVISCVFMNEVAQWNISRKPYWLDYQTLSPPPVPFTPTPTSPSPPPPSLPPPLPATSTAPAVYHLEAIAGIVVGTVLGVAVIVFFAFMLVIWMRHRKKAFGSLDQSAEKPFGDVSPVPISPERDVPTPVEQSDESESEPLTPASPDRRPVELGSSMNDYDDDDDDDDNLGSHLPPPPPPLRPPLRLPTETSDDNSFYYAYALPSLPKTTRFETWSKPRRLSSPSVSLSLLSLHSDRPTRQPQEHCPPLVNSPPVGYSDSGHPPCRCSSSSSLRHETSQRSMMDLGRRLLPEATEHQQETSSGFLPHESALEVNSISHV